MLVIYFTRSYRLLAAVDTPEKPILAVIGGAKVREMDLLAALLEWCDVIAVVGAMANTFLYAKGQEVGRSLYEPDQVALAQSIMQQATEKGVVIYLPQDYVVVAETNEQPEQKTAAEICATDCIYDVGLQTLSALETLATHAQTIVWNGPLGWFDTLQSWQLYFCENSCHHKRL